MEILFNATSITFCVCCILVLVAQVASIIAKHYSEKLSRIFSKIGTVSLVIFSISTILVILIIILGTTSSDLEQVSK